MTGATWYSQPFHGEGGNAADGIRDQLGRPNVSLLTVLVRESAQNSWDAKLPDPESVDYAIDIRTIAGEQAAAWRDLLRPGAPSADHLPLAEKISAESFTLLTISDRGTTGLGGPTRADQAVGADDHDFVSFVRNIGDPRDTPYGGGTYGFGKTIFYRISTAGTILVHTRCRVGDGLFETRLIGCALWHKFDRDDGRGVQPFTGRHWWGRSVDGVIEPLIGLEAEAMARRLGLTPFGERATGTSIAIIAPGLAAEPSMVADDLVDTIMWHLWPKILDAQAGRPGMRFTVTAEGVDHPVPDPRETPPMDMFASAYDRVTNDEAEELRCGNPVRPLGRLGLDEQVVPAITPSRAAEELGIEFNVHHVCLLRAPRLVVTYHAGPKPPSEHKSYAGVFLAREDMDEIYAGSEPPTHDSWNSGSLPTPNSKYVNTTFTRITESLKRMLGLAEPTRGQTKQIALGAASHWYADRLGSVWGTGGGTRHRDRDTDREPGGRGGGTRSGGGRAGGDAGNGRTRRPRVEYVDEPFLAERDGQAVIVQQFCLPQPGSVRLSADLAVSVDANRHPEGEPPVHATTPELLGWENEDTGLVAVRHPLVAGGDNRVWRIIVRPAHDTMTAIAVTAEPEGAER